MKRNAARLIQERRRSRRTNRCLRPGAQRGRAYTASGKGDNGKGGNQRNISRRTGIIEESAARNDIERSNFIRTHTPRRTIFRYRHDNPPLSSPGFRPSSLASRPSSSGFCPICFRRGPGRVLFSSRHPLCHRSTMLLGEFILSRSGSRQNDRRPSCSLRTINSRSHLLMSAEPILVPDGAREALAQFQKYTRRWAGQFL